MNKIKMTENLKIQMIEYCQKNLITVDWDYRDKLSIEQIDQILKGKIDEVIWELENNNFDYMSHMEDDFLNEFIDYFDLLDEDKNFLLDGYGDKWDLRNNFLLDYIERDLNIKKLLNNTNINMRITIHSNNEGYYPMNSAGWNDDYIKDVRKILKGKCDIETLKNEVNNAMCGPNQLIFFGEINISDIYNYNFENWENVTIQPKCICGLYDSWNGSGSILAIKLTKPVTLKRQWGQTQYDDIRICIDNRHKYSVMETYGLSQIPDLKFTLK